MHLDVVVFYFINKLIQRSKDMFRLFFLVMFSSVYTVKAESGKVATVMASPGQGPERSIEIRYTDAKVVGNGSFGVVYQARLVDSNEMVAIKKVLQDKRFKVTAFNFELALKNNAVQERYTK